ALGRLGLPVIDADGYRTHFTRPVERFYEQVAGRAISAEEWEALDADYHDSYLGRLERVALAPDARAGLGGGGAGGGGRGRRGMRPTTTGTWGGWRGWRWRRTRGRRWRRPRRPG